MVKWQAGSRTATLYSHGSGSWTPSADSQVSDDLRLIAGAPEIISGQPTASALGAYAPSDNVLIVKLERPAPYLPQILTHSAAFPVLFGSKRELTCIG